MIPLVIFIHLAIKFWIKQEIKKTFPECFLVIKRQILTQLKLISLNYFIFKTYADKRSHELMKKKEEDREKAVAKEPKKTKQELEEENRQEGLKKTIDASNKGFAMLQKMGYKAGMLNIIAN